MKQKRSYLSVATRYNALCSNEMLTKSEAKELRSLRRALESRGIKTNDRNLIIDLAIVADNEKQVRGYINRHEKAKVCKGRDVGRLNANKLEANALKELGLSTTDHKKVAQMLSSISTGKKIVEKRKKTKKDSIRRHNQPLLDEIEKLEEQFDFEEITEELTEEEMREITEFAKKAFSA